MTTAAISRPMPWHRRQNETDVAYDAFTIYLNMEGRRSTRRVAEIVNKHYSQISMWSAKHDWLDRCRAYDNHVQQVKEEGRRNAVLSFQRLLLADEARDYQELVKQWREKLENSEALTIKDFLLLVETREKIDAMGRRIAEMPTSYSTRTATPALEPVNEEEPMLLSWEDGPHSLSPPLGGGHGVEN